MDEKTPGRSRVLFVCSYNSVRSQMAEGLLRACDGNRFAVRSAGVASAGVSPFAIRVMAEIGIDISGQRSKTLENLAGCEFEYVVTLCRNAARARPLPPATIKVIHRNFRPPCEILKTEEEVLGDFRRLRNELKSWIVPVFRRLS